MAKICATGKSRYNFTALEIDKSSYFIAQFRSTGGQLTELPTTQNSWWKIQIKFVVMLPLHGRARISIELHKGKRSRQKILQNIESTLDDLFTNTISAVHISY